MAKKKLTLPPQKTRTAFILVGPPGSGKSTFRKDLIAGHHNEEITAISSDDILEIIAIAQVQTYNEVFKANYKKAEKTMYEFLGAAIEMNRDIVVDKTNMTAKSRKKILTKIPANYEKIAVVVKRPEDEDLWWHRLANRPGKNIPNDDILKMLESYEPPTKDEGFDVIMEVQST